MEIAEKHVIILGAGASATSGYPVAEKLRLLMSSESSLKAEIEKQVDLDKNVTDQAVETFMRRHMKKTVELFRDGAFGSVDEFCYLSQERFQTQVQHLKLLLRFVFSLHDPEIEFNKSDYYLFIQKLFSTGLFPLRNDVAILTFNYDPYLPYLLRRAYDVRCEATGKSKDEDAIDALTSGFSRRGIDALENKDHLCVLQLHGCIAWPRTRVHSGSLWYGDLFGTTAKQRVEQLTKTDATYDQPPIVFPWEICRESGITCEGEFCLSDGTDAVQRRGAYDGNVTLGQLFAAIWKRAQKEVTRATKISFVGLSMHEFLNPAFKFLFANRKEDAALVCANKDHERFRGTGKERFGEIHLNPLSPTFKLRKVLEQVCSALKGAGSYRREITWGNEDPGTNTRVRVREDFRDFIRNEMD